MKRTTAFLVTALLTTLPAVSQADAKLRVDKNGCHFPHSRNTNVETKLSPCEVLLNFDKATRVAYALGRASAIGVNPAATPASMSPPTTKCKWAPLRKAARCEIYDDDGNMYLSRIDRVRTRVCPREDGLVDINYYLECFGANRVRSRTAARVQEARTAELEAQTFQDDTIYVPEEVPVEIQ